MGLFDERRLSVAYGFGLLRYECPPEIQVRLSKNISMNGLDLLVHFLTSKLLPLTLPSLSERSFPEQSFHPSQVGLATVCRVA